MTKLSDSSFFFLEQISYFKVFASPILPSGENLI